jgi:hypothetical protein
LNASWRVLQASRDVVRTLTLLYDVPIHRQTSKGI